jgi:hypothetical protein
MDYIDAHSHIWTPDVAHYPLGTGFTVKDMKPPSFTAEELLRICTSPGVWRVNLIEMSLYVGQPMPPGSNQSHYEIEVSCMPRFSKNAATGPGARVDRVGS